MLLVLDNEVDPGARYHVDELVRHLPSAVRYPYARGGDPAPDRTDLADAADLADLLDVLDLAGPADLDGVVVSGSTAGVYEADEYPWIERQERLIRRLVAERVPTLGVCFGHQLVNDALGGRVEHRGLRADLVAADLAADPLFEGVNPVVPAIHGDVVVDHGEGMVPIASAPEYPYFATRHRDAPLWTVQFHPEVTARLTDALAADFGWADPSHPFAASNSPRTLRNFHRLATAER